MNINLPWNLPEDGCRTCGAELHKYTHYKSAKHDAVTFSISPELRPEVSVILCAVIASVNGPLSAIWLFFCEDAAEAATPLTVLPAETFQFVQKADVNKYDVDAKFEVDREKHGGSGNFPRHGLVQVAGDRRRQPSWCLWRGWSSDWSRPVCDESVTSDNRRPYRSQLQRHLTHSVMTWGLNVTYSETFCCLWTRRRGGVTEMSACHWYRRSIATTCQTVLDLERQ